jgi:dethiobiotin synthetase
MSLPGLFVVGTDTGVGKTRVASALARSWSAMGRRVGVLKPLSSGAEPRDGGPWSADASALIEAAGGGIPPERVAPFVFEEPLAPPVAARRRGALLTADEVARRVAEALAWWQDRAEVMVVEGVGGLLCPIAEEMTVADLAVILDFPLLVVAHRGLGTLNHTLLTVEAARSRSIRVAGVILNGARPTTDPIAEATNAPEMARRLGGVAILADWEHRTDHAMTAVAPEAGEWYDLALPPRRPWEDGRGRGLTGPLA